MRLKEIRDDSLVHSRILSCFKLHLVDIAIGVANRARDELRALRETFHKAYHLRPHLLEQLAIGQVEKTSRSKPEKASFVQTLTVEKKLLQGKYFQA